jgi:hypothetical protein
MTPAQAAYEAFQKANGLDAIRPHAQSKEAQRGRFYCVEWDRLPDFAKDAWTKAADAARRV